MTEQFSNEVLVFQVADCALDEVELPTGWARDINVLGAGQDAGRDFFINVKRHHQGCQSNTSVVYFYAALPDAYREIVDLQGPDAEALMQVIRKSDGGVSMGTKPEDLAVEGRAVRSVEPLKMGAKTQGTMSTKLPDGVLQENCF